MGEKIKFRWNIIFKLDNSHHAFGGLFLGLFYEYFDMIMFIKIVDSMPPN